MNNRLVAGFYHDPPLWVGERPVNDDTEPPTVNFAMFNNKVARQTLAGGLEFRVSVEGFFAFDFTNWSPAHIPNNMLNTIPDFDVMVNAAINQTYVMNAYLAFFYTKVYLEDNLAITPMVVTPELLIPMNRLETDDGRSLGNYRVAHLAMSRFESTYAFPPIVDPRIAMRLGPIPASVAHHAADDLSAAVAQGPDDILLLDLFLRGSKAYFDHNYSLSLVTHWTVAEKLINILWKHLQEDNKERAGEVFIDGNRRKRLNDGRTFTASVMSELLSFQGYIPQDVYTHLTLIRKARNDWMHDLKAVSADDAALASGVCEKLLKQVKGYEMRSAGFRRIHG